MEWVLEKNGEKTLGEADCTCLKFEHCQTMFARLHLATMEVWIHELLRLLALPEYGLSSVFVVALVSATLLPLGSEPVVLGLVHLNAELFWPAIGVATLGNTLGGALTWWMGRGPQHLVKRMQTETPQRARALRWLETLGPKACLLSWLPLVGDPLCAVAGWLKLPFWPCLGYMALGKFGRYLGVTAGWVWVVG